MKVNDPPPPDPRFRVEPTPGAANLGDRKKSTQERREDVEEVRRDQTTISAKLLGASEEINLSGISSEDARKLSQAPAFLGWGTPYTGDIPTGLQQLHGALKHAGKGALEAGDHIHLESAGSRIDQAMQDAGGRVNPSHADTLAALREQAQEIGAELASGRGRAK